MKITSIILFIVMTSLFVWVYKLNPKASLDDGSFMFMVVLIILGIASGIGSAISFLAYLANY